MARWKPIRLSVGHYFLVEVYENNQIINEWQFLTFEPAKEVAEKFDKDYDVKMQYFTYNACPFLPIVLDVDYSTYPVKCSSFLIQITYSQLKDREKGRREFMNLLGYTFKNCTLEDAANRPHMLVPMDMIGILCYPGDIVCAEEDVNCLNPFVVAGICVYDSGDGVQECIIDSLGQSFYADEVFHVAFDADAESGYSMMKQLFCVPSPYL